MKLNRIETGVSTNIQPGKFWVAVWREFTNHLGRPDSDIIEELYATPEEWREIIKQVSELLDTYDSSKNTI